MSAESLPAVDKSIAQVHDDFRNARITAAEYLSRVRALKQPVLARLHESFPNAPEEVLTDWLEPRAEQDGVWPPETDFRGVPIDGMWRHRLREQSLTYWRSCTWHKVSRQIHLKDLNPIYRTDLPAIVRATMEDEKNHLSDAVADLKPSFARILSYLATRGRLPKPPILWITRNGLEILEGHRRMSVFLYSRNEITSTARPQPSPCNPTQTFWIASEHPLLVPIMFPSEVER